MRPAKISRGAVAALSGIWNSGYWAKLNQAKWVILGIGAVTFVLSWARILDRFETAGLDTLNILSAPRDPTHVVIIGIDDIDYTELFKETSPLESEGLQKILNAIANARPRVIGVDIDTSHELSRTIHTEADWPPVVWGRDALWNEETRTIEPLRVLGGLNPARNMDAAAIAQLPQDADGLIRRYRRHFRAAQGTDADSFPWAVVKAACAAPRPMEDCHRVSQDTHEETILLNFAGQRFSFKPLSARVVQQIGNEDGWKAASPLRDKIVLLGGYYHAGRDTQVTPIGRMAGVQLMAQAIETELGGGGIRPVNEYLAFVLDLLAGAILVYISYRYPLRLRRALVVSLLALVILPLLSSYLAFSTLGRWFNFVPMIVGVLLHELYEHGREYQRLRQRALVIEGSVLEGADHDASLASVMPREGESHVAVGNSAPDAYADGARAGADTSGPAPSENAGQEPGPGVSSGRRTG